MTFSRLIRFVADDGKTYYGDLKEEFPSAGLTGSKVDVLEGDPFTGLSSAGKQATVKEVLSPIERTPLIPCIGLNYRQHANEAGLPIADFPVVFIKPADALTGPFDPVPITPLAQEKLDYEGELTIIIGKDGKNIPEESALDYVLGYTAGNDVSARNFQLPPASGGQFCYAKGFDGFAPIGPVIVSPSIIPDPHALEYTTKVNGELRQQTPTSDMIWSVKQIIAHLSRGYTLRKGTAIMTGTPSGVALFRNDGFLKDGDEVEVSISKIGAIKNKMVFEKK